MLPIRMLVFFFEEASFFSQTWIFLVQHFNANQTVIKKCEIVFHTILEDLGGDTGLLWNLTDALV